MNTEEPKAPDDVLEIGGRAVDGHRMLYIRTRRATTLLVKPGDVLAWLNDVRTQVVGPFDDKEEHGD